MSARGHAHEAGSTALRSQLAEMTSSPQASNVHAPRILFGQKHTDDRSRLQMIRRVLPIILLAACATSGEPDLDPGLSLTIEPAVAAAGQSVTLTLNNQTAWPVGYNLCTSLLERESGGSWEPVREDRVCTMELRMLAPEATAREQIELPPVLEPGAYRFSANVEDRGSIEQVASAPFQVR
jgi:hypothetical protein